MINFANVFEMRPIELFGSTIVFESSSLLWVDFFIYIAHKVKGLLNNIDFSYGVLVINVIKDISKNNNVIIVYYWFLLFSKYFLAFPEN